jgi:3-methyladenine DNA glycosylase AlkD
MPMYEEIIVGAAWWDVVDTVAAHGVGPIVAAHPAVMRPMMRAWSRDENLWRRRAAILCQIRRRGAADRALLQDCLAPSLGSKEFFLRKAVGWALREVAWDDPTWVVRYVRAHARELAPLSKREALKNVIEQGLARDIP